jgi:hypothetical protein
VNDSDDDEEEKNDAPTDHSFASIIDDIPSVSTRVTNRSPNKGALKNLPERNTPTRAASQTPSRTGVSPPSEREQLLRKVDRQRKEIAQQKRQEELEDAQKKTQEAAKKERTATERKRKEAILRNRLKEQRMQKAAEDQQAARAKAAKEKEQQAQEDEERKKRALDVARMRTKLLERDRAHKRAAKQAERERQQALQDEVQGKQERLEERRAELHKKKELQQRKKLKGVKLKEKRMGAIKQRQHVIRERLVSQMNSRTNASNEDVDANVDDLRTLDNAPANESSYDEIDSQETELVQDDGASDDEFDAPSAASLQVTNMRSAAERVLFNEEPNAQDERFQDSYYSSGDDAPTLNMSQAYGDGDDVSDYTDTDTEDRLFQSYIDGLDNAPKTSLDTEELGFDEDEEAFLAASPKAVAQEPVRTPVSVKTQNFISVPDDIMAGITNPSTKLQPSSPDGLWKHAPSALDTDLYNPSPLPSARQTYKSPRYQSPRIRGNPQLTPNRRQREQKRFERLDVGSTPSDKAVPPERLQRRLAVLESDRKLRLAAKKKRDEGRAAELEFKRIEAEQIAEAKKEQERQERQQQQKKAELQSKKAHELNQRQEEYERKQKVRKRQANARERQRSDTMDQYASENRGYADMHTQDTKESVYSVQDSLTMRDLEHELSRLNSKIDANLEKDAVPENTHPEPSLVSSRPTANKILRRNHFASQKKPLVVRAVAKKSNSKLIINALKFVCLAGEVHKTELQHAMIVLKDSKWPHYMILFKEQGGNHVYRAIYGYDAESSSSELLCGDGPTDLGERGVLRRYRYNSGHKRFDLLSVESFTPIVDAFSLRRTKSSLQPDSARPSHGMSRRRSGGTQRRVKRVNPDNDKRSNRKVIQNALTFNCLAGAINSEERSYALQEVKSAPGGHFLVMFMKRGGNMVYRAIYVWDSTRGIKVYGDGPDYIDESRISSYYKYNTSRKVFQPLQIDALTATCDAIVLKKKSAASA